MREAMDVTRIREIDAAYRRILKFGLLAVRDPGVTIHNAFPDRGFTR